MRTKTNLKVILAAMSVAVLASPVTAQTWRDERAPLRGDLSTDNVFWGEVHEPPHAYGSAVHRPAGPPASGVTVDGHPRIVDCVHVTFPQCSGGN
jgi:hypothetical protein